MNALTMMRNAALRRNALNAFYGPQTSKANALQGMMDNARPGSVGAPGGLQPNPMGPTGRDPITEGLQLSSFVPGIGDAAGLAGDIRMMATQPETRTFPNALMTLAGALPFIPAMTVFHGSPHRFDAFDLKKIGTGEGAQAYGHGLYFAESPDVARQYREGLSIWSPEIDGKPVIEAYAGGELPAMLRSRSSLNPAESHTASKILYKSAREGRPFDDVFNEAVSESNRIAKTLEFDNAEELASLEKIRREIRPIAPSPTKGALYEVDIPDEAIEKMLDWDAPLSEQPEAVKLELEKIYRDYRGSAESNDWGLAPFAELDKGDNPTGAEILELLTREHGSSGASEILKESGIPGIKYYDGMSRQGGKGTRNFVVFDDKLPKMLKRE